MPHLLPCLITFNIVGYITERELNNWCGVSSICNPLHMELHLTSSIVCCTLSCQAYLNGHASSLIVHHAMFMWCLFTILFASFWLFFLIVSVTLRLWGSVRLCWFVYFMVSFFFLAESRARWPLPSISLLSLLASCSLYRYVALPTTCLSCLPYCHVKPLTILS